MRDHAAKSGSNGGLTDQTTPDLYGIVVPLHSVVDVVGFDFVVDVVAQDAGKETKSLSGGCRGAKPPTSRPPAELTGRTLRRAQRRRQREELRACALVCATCGTLFEGTRDEASDQAFRHTSAHAAQLSLLDLNE